MTTTTAKKSRAPLFVGLILIFMLGLAVVGSLLALVLLGAGLRMPRVGSGDVVGLVRIDGAIYNADETLADLEFLRDHKGVRALVVRIDSPGGAVGASQEIHLAIQRFRDQAAAKGRDLPVVASMGNVAASGGYYVACAADEIVAPPGAMTGSIGVILSSPELSRLFNIIGVRYNTITAGEFKDAGAMDRPMTAGERAMLQALLDDVHDQFISDVRDGRRQALLRHLGLETHDGATTDPIHADADVDLPALTEYVRSLADGRILTGRQAMEAGLVDSMGNLDDAVERARTLARLPESASVIERPRRRGLRDLLLASVEGATRLMGPINRPVFEVRSPW